MKFEEIVEFNRTDDVKTTKEFASLMLSKCSLQALAKNGYISPSPVQVQAIPIGLLGFDVVVQAKSGTGKTLVFSLLALEGLNAQVNYPQVLILAPTREIALQICSVIVRLSPRVVRIGAFVGGDKPVREDVALLKKGIHVVIGTSGRLCHLVSIKALKIDRIRLFVLDEADKLMDENFKNDINYLFSFLPVEKQVAVFSATYPHNIDDVLSQYMRSPRLVRAGTDVQLIGIKQYVIVQYFKSAIETLVTLLETITFSQCIVYANDQIKCQKIYEHLLKKKSNVALISSAVDQNERNKIIKLLKNFSVKILVSTDLTARGIDAENVNVVVNMGVPLNCETYLHRIGRAGRFGGYGAAFTILASRKEVRNFIVLVKEGDLHVRLLHIENTFPSNLCQDEAYYNNCVEFVADRQKEFMFEANSKNERRKSDASEKEFSDGDENDVINVVHRKQSKYTTFSDTESNSNAVLFDSLNNTINTNREILHNFLVPKKEINIGCSNACNSSIFMSEQKMCYSKEEMIDIRNTSSLTYWLHYALDRFDSNLFNAPFVSKSLLKLLKDRSRKKFSNESYSDSSNKPQSLSNNEVNSVPKKRKLNGFKFHRTTPKRHVYTKSGLMQICQSKTANEWHNLALALFDMSYEPFILSSTSGTNWDEDQEKFTEELCVNVEEIRPSAGFEVSKSKRDRIVKLEFHHKNGGPNVYSKQSLMDICHLKTVKEWENLASVIFDVSQEPFVVSCTSDTNSALIDGVSVSSIKMPGKKLERKIESDITSNDIVCYSRDALLALRDCRPTGEWELWAKNRFNVSDEPFQLDQELRVPVPIQLRILRKREKAMRKSVQNPAPQNEEGEELNSHVIACSRFVRIIEPLPSSVDEYKSRIMDEFNSGLHKPDMRERAGPVVLLRHTPENFKNIVTLCANCIDRRRMDFLHLVFKDSYVFSDAASDGKETHPRAFSSIGVQVDLPQNSKKVPGLCEHCSNPTIYDEIHSFSSEHSSETCSEYKYDFLSTSDMPQIDILNTSCKKSDNSELYNYFSKEQDVCKPLNNFMPTTGKSVFSEYLQIVNSCLHLHQNGFSQNQ